MGCIAYIRQIYLDADHYKLVKDAYAQESARHAAARVRPRARRRADSKRILLPANRLVEIDRMLHFAEELKQPTILYGVREGFRPEAAADHLKKAELAGAGQPELARSGARSRSRR